MVKRLLSFMALCAAAIMSQASPVQGTITTKSEYGMETLELDFNNDGKADFIVSGGYACNYVSSKGCAIRFYDCDMKNNIWVVGSYEAGSGWDVIKSLPEGTQIGASSNWSSEGDCNLFDLESQTNCEQLAYNTDLYFGFKINNNFGWARVYLTKAADGSVTADWKEIYYESEQGKAIAAGAKAVGVESAEQGLSLYPNPVKETLYISADVVASEALIYDVNGRLCKSVSSLAGNSINVSDLASGMYVVVLKGEKELSQKIIKK